MASPNWLENFFSFSPEVFPKNEKYFLGNVFLAFLFCHFCIFNPFLYFQSRYSVKIMRNNRRLNILFRLATYKNQWEVWQLKIFNKPKIQKSKSFLQLVISKAANLIELWIHFNDKYLRGNRLPHLVIKASIWGMTHSLKFEVESDETMVY